MVRSAIIFTWSKMTQKRKIQSAAMSFTYSGLCFMECFYAPDHLPCLCRLYTEPQVFHPRFFITVPELLWWENWAIYGPDMLIRPCVLVKQIEDLSPTVYKQRLSEHYGAAVSANWGRNQCVVEKTISGQSPLSCPSCSFQLYYKCQVFVPKPEVWLSWRLQSPDRKQSTATTST